MTREHSHPATTTRCGRCQATAPAAAIRALGRQATRTPRHELVTRMKSGTAMTEPGPGPAKERLAYSINEVAQITGLSRDLLYDQMRTGKLAYLKVGRRRIITRRHLEAFLALGSA